MNLIKLILVSESRLSDQQKQDIVELEITEESSTPELLDVLGKVEGVRGLSAENGTVSLLAVDGNAALPELISAANTKGVRVSNVAIQEPMRGCGCSDSHQA